MEQENELMKSYIGQLEELFSGDPWIDETFEKKLKELSEEIAFRKPMESMHSVAEILSHLIVWRREILSRIKDKQSPHLTMENEYNWKGNEALRQNGFFQLLDEFNETQEQLIDFLGKQNDEFLLLRDDQKNVSFDYYIRGLVHHDAYHLGQIGMVLKILQPIKQ